MNNTDELLTITDSERKAIVQNGIELIKWAHTLSKEQIAYLFNGGWYNDTIKGYLIASARNAELDEETIDRLLYGLNTAFSEYDKATAEKIYYNR